MRYEVTRVEEVGARASTEPKTPLGGTMNVKRVFSVSRVQDQMKKREQDDLRGMATNEASKVSKSGRKREAE